LSDRAVEVCEPLFKIAIAAGGDWYKRIRAATAALFGPEEDDDKKISQLSAVRDAFQTWVENTKSFQKDERLSTSDLVERLLAQEDSTFPDWWWKKDANTKSIGKSLAGILKPFGVKAKNFRIEGEAVRGYERADLEPVWEHYCTQINDANPSFRYSDVADVASVVNLQSTRTYAATSGTLNVPNAAVDVTGIIS